MPQFRHSLLGAAAMLAFAGSLAFAAPVLAADASPAPAAKAAKPAVDPVEARIAKLHQQLQITAGQEELFNGLAQVMRDNRTAHDSLVIEKKKAEKTQTALDDLQAYALIAQAHADGVKKLATAFEALYGSLSDVQKKAADDAFRQHKQRMMARGMPRDHGAMPRGPMNGQGPMTDKPAQ